MTAWQFVLTGDQGSATGVICVEARYASVQRDGAERPERRHVAPTLWRRLEHELADTLPAAALPATSAIVEALLPEGERRSVRVQYLAGWPVDPESSGLVARLDGLLAG